VFNTVSKNQAIVIEDLAVQNMMRNRHLAQSLGDASLGYIRVRLQQKTEEWGRTVIVAGRWFPSSRLCPCGVVHSELLLSDRAWTCPTCCHVNDRDRNAARNLESWPALWADHPRWGAAGTRAELVVDGPRIQSTVVTPAVTPEGPHRQTKQKSVSLT
jgi:putative transposase